MKENLMQRKRRYLLTPKKELTERCLLIEQEIERLNNIINELEKWLEEVSHYEEYNFVERSTFIKILIKLNELKGDSSNENN